ncbi:MAG: hypothetical protein Kow009_01820 [Spirochaetales bacterium]
MVEKRNAEQPSTPSGHSIEEKPISLDPLFGIPMGRIPPRDFELGVLKPAEPLVQDAVKAAEEIFVRLQQGRPLTDLLHPEYRWFLEEDLKPWMGNPLPMRDFRLGSVQASPPFLAEIPFRILQEGRIIRGTLLLEKAEDRWYVADFSLDWETTVRAGSTEPFDPFLETR